MDRLLIVDAPGGPVPETYWPMLPQDMEIQVVMVVENETSPTLERYNYLRRRCLVHPVRDRSLLKEQIERVARSWKANGILALSEQVVHDAGFVAHRLGLPSNSPITQKALQNKEFQRQLLQRAGITIPHMHRIEREEDLLPAARQVGFPAVLKPIVGLGSLSVYEVNSFDELQSLFKTAVELYTIDLRVQAKPAFLLESKWIGEKWHPDQRMGDHVSVESIVASGKILHLAVTDKLPLIYPFREQGDIMPSTLPRDKINILFQETEKAINALGIETGAIHTEIKLTAQGPRIIEVNGRIGGGVTEMLYYSAGYNVIDRLARVAVGEGIGHAPSFTGYAAFFTPQPPATRIRLIRVPEEAEYLKLQGVLDAKVVYSAGSEPDWRKGTSAHLSRIIAASSDWSALMDLGMVLCELHGFEYIKLEEIKSS
jgi:biotin carboxylase